MPTVTLEAWLAKSPVISTPVGLIQGLEPRYGPLVERVPLDPTPQATAGDFDGPAFTIHSLRMYHSETIGRWELLVVDNTPEKRIGERL